MGVDVNEPRLAGGHGPIDATVVPRYAGFTTFARLPQAGDESADVGIQGIPFDAGVSYRPGARFGPSHVREASRLLRPLNSALNVEPFGVQRVVDLGDIPANPFSITDAIAQIEEGTRHNLERTPKIATIGGDHTITLPILRALHALYGPIAVVHFDAHLDTWDTYFNSPYTHGTTFLRASEEGLLAKGNCMHAGIRSSLYSYEDLPRDRRAGFELVTTDECSDIGPQGVAEKITDATAGFPVYLSVDIDVLDPAFAPGTGTPEAGGMQSRELLRMIRALSSLNVVGMDVVEVAPAYDHAQITGVAGAHVVYEMLSVWALTKGTNAPARSQ
jgi:agmatinase